MSDYADYVRSQTIADVEAYTNIGQVHKDIVSVEATDTVEEVLKVLKDNYIVSVPVVDKKSTSVNGTPFYAIANIVDLLTAFAFQPVFGTFDTDSSLKELKEETLATLVATQTKVLKSPVSNYVGLSSESKTLWAFDEKESLSRILDIFSVGVHRVLVSHKSRENNYWSFVSQTDVLRYLKVQSYRREAKIKGVFLTKLSDLTLGGQQDQKFSTLPETASAITGFRTMIQNNELSALPIVDESGKLINTLSAADFRHVSLENFKETLLPASKFLTLHRGKRYVSITARADELLSSIVDKLLLRAVHRVWIVDADGKPTGAVSLTDIIKTFSIYAPSSDSDATP